MYSSYFFECLADNHDDWFKADDMLRDFQWKTKDLKEAIAWAKVASLSTGVTIEVLQSECDTKIWTKEWYCLAIVRKCKVTIL
jgi:hypothetical protein